MSKFFDKRLYKESIKEIFNVSVALVAIGIVATALTFWFYRGEIIVFYSSTVAFDTVDIALFILMILGSSLLAGKMVSFAFSKQKTDIASSLPYTKGQLFCSKMLAAVSMQFAVLTVVGLFGALLSIVHMGKIVFIGDIIMMTVNGMIGSLIIIGAVFLSIGLTGKKTSSVLITGWVVLAPALMFIFRLFSVYYKEVAYRSYFIQKIDLYIIPNMLMKALGAYNAMWNLPSIVFSILLFVSIFVAGYMLFQKRSDELAEKYTGSKLVYFLVIGFLPFIIIFLMVSFLFTTPEINIDIIKIAGFLLGMSVVFAFSLERVIREKTERKNRYIWIVLASAVAGFAFVSSAILIGQKDEYRTIVADEVESVAIVQYGEYGMEYSIWDDASYGDYLSTKYTMENTGMINKVVNLYSVKSKVFTGMQKQLVKIKLKSNKTILTQVPVIVDRGNGCGNTKTDMDDAIYREEDYMSYLYTPIPQKYITHIYDNNMYDVENKQDGLREVFAKFADEFTELDYKKKREISQVNGVSWSMSYSDIYMNYDEDCIIPIGYIYVRGRVGSNNVIDKYKLTGYTPMASNAYIQMVYERNVESYRGFTEKYRGNPNIENCPYDVTLYYMGEDNRIKIMGDNFFMSSLSNDYRKKIGNAIKEYDLQMPEIGDVFVAVEYIDPKVGETRSIFIKISKEQASELRNIYEEYNE